VVQLQAVFLGEVTHFLQSLSLITQVRQLIHQQTIAGGGPQGIHHQHLVLGVFFSQLLGRDAGGIDRTGKTGRQADMQDILALLEETLKVGRKFIHIHLRSLGHFTGRHTGVELIERHALAQVIRVALIPQHIVEADIVNITAFKVLLGKIRSGAAAQNVFGHQFTSFIFGHCPQM